MTILTGICLEICAAALGTTSKQLIAYSEHVKKRWIFHIGATINIAVGPIVDASAYAFAPQVVIAPFACLDVIFNALTAPYTLSWQNEQLTRMHIIGTILVSVGAAFTAVFGSVHDETLDVIELEAQLLRPASIAYLSIEAFAIITINMLLRAQMLTATVRGIALGVIAGVLMGNVFCVKGFIGLVRTSIDTGSMEAWLRPTPYILIVVAAGGAIVGHIFMRKGLGEYKGVFMVTIFEGAHITAACLSGCVVMSELDGTPWWQYLLYWLSVGLIVLGMLVINTQAPDAKLGKSFHIAQAQFAAVPTTDPQQIGRSWSENLPQPSEDEQKPQLKQRSSQSSDSQSEELQSMVEEGRPTKPMRSTSNGSAGHHSPSARDREDHHNTIRRAASASPPAPTVRWPRSEREARSVSPPAPLGAIGCVNEAIVGATVGTVGEWRGHAAVPHHS